MVNLVSIRMVFTENRGYKRTDRETDLEMTTHPFGVFYSAYSNQQVTLNHPSALGLISVVFTEYEGYKRTDRQTDLEMTTDPFGMFFLDHNIQPITLNHCDTFGSYQCGIY